MTNEEINKITKDWESFQLRLYLLGYAKFSKALKKQIEPILLSLQQTNNVNVVMGLSSELISTLAIQEAMIPFITTVSDRTAKQFAKTYVRYLPKDVNIGVGFGSAKFRQEMLDYINTIGNAHVKDITETTRKLVNKAFIDGIENGDTISQLGKRITSYTLGSNGSGLQGRINVRARALLIAKTETLMASGMAKDLQQDEYPYLFEKQWIHGHVKEPRHEHVDAVNKRKDKNDTWTLYGRKMKYAGDKDGGAINNCNCRCSTVYVPKQDKNGKLLRKN